MAVLGREGALKFVKDSKKTPVSITEAREYKMKLEALIKGKGYKDLLIQIDNVESTKKQETREKYTFSMKDLFERLSTNIENVWTATGGVKIYYPDDKNGNDKKREELIKLTSNVRGGKTLEQWNESFWMPTYHTDPAGVTFLEYDAKKGIDPFPVYKSIDKIRNYIPNGINVEVILFEAKEIKTENEEHRLWRLVDDETDYLIKDKNDVLTIIDKGTFNHPFGQVPALINSDLIDTDNITRLSPYDTVLELCEEYLRDKSIKTIFKFMQGFPLFWRYVTKCQECAGTKKVNDSTCSSCNGHGFMGRRDVTDTVNIMTPTLDAPAIAGDIAGFISPPLDVWDQYTTELDLLERAVRMTLWGAIIEDDRSNTATGRRIDAQPILQKLNKYSGASEVRERKQTEWIANYSDSSKDKNERVSSVSYGRNYSLLSSDTILELYQTAKAAGDNNTTLDDLFNQYLLARYKNDPISLRIAKIKADVEPYLHYDLEQIKSAFGQEGQQTKILFDEWWRSVILNNKTTTSLKEEFNAWVQDKFKKVEINE